MSAGGRSLTSPGAWAAEGVLCYGGDTADAVILLHEIYGVNSHMKDAAAQLAAQGLAVYCPDLLGMVYGYEQEEAAYAHFVRQVGFTAAAEKVAALAGRLKNRHRNVYLVGYSAGATVAWLCSDGGNIAGMVGYYGSRIRDFLDLSPACPVLLFYPCREEAFPVAVLAEDLTAKDGVRVHILQGQHGFADRYSPRYDAAAAAAAAALTAAFLGGVGR